MRLPRPYIPLSVRVEVARRQVTQGMSNPDEYLDWIAPKEWPLKLQLKTLLFDLCCDGTDKYWDDSPLHLDHDPALQNRERYADKTGIHYIPDANDPNYLIYRTAQDHKIKTLVRGDGAQHSDAALARKNKRIARNRNPKRIKRKWPSRPFSKRGTKS